MVAFVSSYTPAESLTRTKNRAGDFFWSAPDRAGVDRLGIETASGKNALIATTERQSPSLAQGKKQVSDVMGPVSDKSGWAHVPIAYPGATPTMIWTKSQSVVAGAEVALSAPVGAAFDAGGTLNTDGEVNGFVGVDEFEFGLDLGANGFLGWFNTSDIRGDMSVTGFGLGPIQINIFTAIDPASETMGFTIGLGKGAIFGFTHGRSGTATSKSEEKQ
jgi:hypothetical protein